MFLRFLEKEELKKFIDIIIRIKAVNSLEKDNLSSHKIVALHELQFEINNLHGKEIDLLNGSKELDIEIQKTKDEIEKSNDIKINTLKSEIIEFCKSLSEAKRETKRCIFLEICLFVLVDDEFSKAEKDILENVKNSLGIDPSAEIKSLYLATSLINVFKDSTRFLQCYDNLIDDILKDIDDYNENIQPLGAG